MCTEPSEPEEPTEPLPHEGPYSTNKYSSTHVVSTALFAPTPVAASNRLSTAVISTISSAEVVLPSINTGTDFSKTKMKSSTVNMLQPSPVYQSTRFISSQPSSVNHLQISVKSSTSQVSNQHSTLTLLVSKVATSINPTHVMEKGSSDIFAQSVVSLQGVKWSTSRIVDSRSTLQMIPVSSVKGKVSSTIQSLNSSSQKYVMYTAATQIVATQSLNSTPAVNLADTSVSSAVGGHFSLYTITILSTKSTSISSTNFSSLVVLPNSSVTKKTTSVDVSGIKSASSLKPSSTIVPSMSLSPVSPTMPVNGEFIIIFHDCKKLNLFQFLLAVKLVTW